MILFDSTYEETYRQMKAEREKVRYYAEKHKRDAVKRLRTMRRPWITYRIQTIPGSKNTYLHYYSAESAQQILEGDCAVGSVLLVNGDKGKQLVIKLVNAVVFDEFESESKEASADILNIVTGHLLSRFRERFPAVSGLGTHELIASFAARNLAYMRLLRYEDFVKQENIEPCGVAYATKDGVMLGQCSLVTTGTQPFIVNIHKTFLGRDMLKEQQADMTPGYAQIQDDVRNYFLWKHNRT